MSAPTKEWIAERDARQAAVDAWIAKAIPEARGYAHGIENAAQVAESLGREWSVTRTDHAVAATRIANEIRALLTPKAGAK